MRLWPAPVVVFVMQHWEKQGYEGFAGAHRVLDLLKNLGCELESLSWLADQAFLGARGERDDGSAFDLLLDAALLNADRETLARVLKGKLAVDRRTRAIARVQPGRIGMKQRARRSLPSTASLLGRGVRQTTVPVCLSSATRNCSSAPSQASINRSSHSTGELPGPVISWTAKRCCHTICPVASETATVPSEPKWQ